MLSSTHAHLFSMCRILKNAIGGNCLTVVLGMLSPSSHNRSETLNTIDFCVRAARVQCKPVKDETQILGMCAAVFRVAMVVVICLTGERMGWVSR